MQYQIFRHSLCNHLNLVDNGPEWPKGRGIITDNQFLRKSVVFVGFNFCDQLEQIVCRHLSLSCRYFTHMTVTLPSKTVVYFFTPNSSKHVGYSAPQASGSCAFTYKYCIFHDSCFDILQASGLPWFYKQFSGNIETCSFYFFNYLNFFPSKPELKKQKITKRPRSHNLLNFQIKLP